MGFYIQDDMWEAVSELPRKTQDEVIGSLARLFFEGEQTPLKGVSRSLFVAFRDRVILSTKRSECGKHKQSCLVMAKMFGVVCKEETCLSCMVKMMTAIADRIDAERALPDGMEWPRFEDGGLVRIGDELEFEGKTMLVCDATFYADGWALWCDREDMSGRLYGKYGERVERPAPKVLDADGV